METHGTFKDQVQGRTAINWMVVVAVVIVAVCAGVYTALVDNDAAPSGPQEYQPTEADMALIKVLHSEAVPAGSDAGGLQDEVMLDTPPAGKIIFSGRKTNSTSSIQVHALDVSTSSEPELFETFFAISALAEFKDPLDPSEFFVSAVSKFPLVYEDSFGIHAVDAEAKTVKYLKSASSTGERYLAWSPEAALLAFSRTSNSHARSVDNIQIQNWETVIVDPETDEIVKVIPDASQPKWSPDGTTLIYIKHDGLYAAPLGEGEEVKVLGSEGEGQFLVNAMMEVSPDKKHLIWTIPGNGVIAVYDIESWETFALKEIGRIEQDNIQFYWPVFSPDGAYYAVQAINDPERQGEGRKNPRLEVRPLLGKNVVFQYSFAGYNFNALFLDSWIADSN